MYIYPAALGAHFCVTLLRLPTTAVRGATTATTTVAPAAAAAPPAVAALEEAQGSSSARQVVFLLITVVVFPFRAFTFLTSHVVVFCFHCILLMRICYATSYKNCTCCTIAY